MRYKEATKESSSLNLEEPFITPNNERIDVVIEYITATSVAMSGGLSYNNERFWMWMDFDTRASLKFSKTGVRALIVSIRINYSSQQLSPCFHRVR